jgi:hypothetical protein
MYIINVIADDETKIGLYEIYLLKVERSKIFKDRFFYNMEIFWEMVWSKLFNV